MDEYSKLEHIRISNPRAWQSEILLGRSLCFSQKSKLIKYLLQQRTLSTLAQKSKLLNKNQIFLREFDENSWKLDINIRLLSDLVLWKHLSAAVRYQVIVFKSPLILGSASILCRSLYLSYDLIYSTLHSAGSFSNFITTTLLKMSKGRPELIAKCVFLYSTLVTSCRNGPCLSESR